MHPILQINANSVQVSSSPSSIEMRALTVTSWIIHARFRAKIPGITPLVMLKHAAAVHATSTFSCSVPARVPASAPRQKR